MKRLLIAILIIAMIFVFGGMVFAQENVQIDSEEVSEEGVGLLPDNPFYFLKEWRRGVSRALIFDPVRKAEFELDITNEKARELERLAEREDSNEGSLERASKNYEKAVERLRLRLEGLEENSENPNIERLLNQVNERVTSHERVMEGLSDKFESVRHMRERLQQVGEGLERFVGTPARDGVPDEVKERAQEVFQERAQQLREHADDIDLEKLPERIKDFGRGIDPERIDNLRNTINNRAERFRVELQQRMRNAQ